MRQAAKNFEWYGSSLLVEMIPSGSRRLACSEEAPGSQLLSLSEGLNRSQGEKWGDLLLNNVPHAERLIRIRIH